MYGCEHSGGLGWCNPCTVKKQNRECVDLRAERDAYREALEKIVGQSETLGEALLYAEDALAKVRK